MRRCTPTAALALMLTVVAAAPTARSAASTPSTTGLAKAVGQMTISALPHPTAGHALLRRIRDGHIGGVILFGPNIETHAQVRALVRSLQHAAKAGGNPPLLVMTDQEGGTAKRFATIPPTASAKAMGHTPASAIRAQGRATGRGLLADGVNLDLAPVADVPTSSHSFLGTRAFSHDDAKVTRDACAFAAGLHDAGAGATLKHFPGLGRAPGNTDDQSVTIAASATTLLPELAPYRMCASAPRTLVMVSSAIYAPLTAGLPAVTSPIAYSLLRTGLGFDGPTISDDLDAAAVAHVPNLAAAAAAAGLDLELWGSQSTARAGYAALLKAVRSGRVPAARIRQAAARIATLKASLGLH